MRAFLLMLPLLICAAPAAAQTQAPAPAAPPRSGQAIAEMQRQITDPATADKLTRMMQVLSKSFMNLPVGEIQAAAEGRAPTAAERKMTVKDAGRRSDPNFERNAQAQMANARPMIEQSLKAMAATLPALMQSLQAASQSLERATSSMPSPTYPKR